MTPENFCYWLQGFFELQDPFNLTVEQVEDIKNHLNLVFQKVTPPVSKPSVFPPPFEEQKYCGIVGNIPISDFSSSLGHLKCCSSIPDTGMSPFSATGEDPIFKPLLFTDKELIENLYGKDASFIGRSC